MITKKSNQSRNNIQMIDLESLVPEKHILRKIDKLIDFEFIREIVKEYYSEEVGRPSIDPVVLFKIVFIQFLFGIKSMRQTIKEIEVNNAYRWFLGYGLLEPIPHFSTFGKNYVRRFADNDVFEQIFKHILKLLIGNGFIKEDTYFVDSTHIKAYANKRNVHNEYIDEDYDMYSENLHKEINEIRKHENKREINFNKKKKVAVSNVDADSGMFHKGEKEKQLAYSVQTAVDENGYVIDCRTVSGSMNDNQSGATFVDKLTDNHPNTKAVVMDAGYTSPVLLDILISKGIQPVVPYQKPKGKKLEQSNDDEKFYYTKNYFKYQEQEDYYLCPWLKKLTYRGMNSQGYKLYMTSKKDCLNCPYKYKCTNQNTKSVTRHLLEYTKANVKEFRLSDEGRELYAKRKYTVERTFAQCKMSHCLGFTLVRGLKKNQDRNLILYTVANIKKLALFVMKTNKEISKLSTLVSSYIRYFVSFFFKSLKKNLVFPN
ncbi:IS1182 family transposase [Dehalobacterium formicoaceticum]|uniref:IS1182 family transposase n=1 Tax=Dehalobacterium formicoaceticum TaxID=51515 RepID=UPI0031F6948D